MKSHLPYISCLCNSLKESTDQFVSSSSIKIPRLDCSLSNCENELICKCYSDGKVIVENFNRDGYLLRLKEGEGFRYVSCAFGLISNRRLMILARSDNMLIILLEGLNENIRVFNQIESFLVPSSSNVTCLDVNQFRGSNLIMNSIIVGCYDGSLHVFTLMLSNQDQLLVAHQPFPNFEGHKSIGIVKVKEESNTMMVIGSPNANSSLLYITRTDGVLQVCRLTTRRTLESVTSEIESLKCIATNSCGCALSFCDLLIDRETVKVIAISGIDYFSIYYSNDNFANYGKIIINLPIHRVITSILALRLEREDKDMLSLLFGDELGQLYRVKITDLKCPSITIEPKNLLGTPQSSSMVMQSVLVRRSSDKNSIIFTTRRDETQTF